MKAVGSTWPGDTRASKASASGDFQHTVQPQAHTELLPGLQSASNPQPQSVPVNQTPLMNPGALSAQAVVALGPSGNLTASQRGELELAKARAERAAASRKTTGASGSSAAGRSSSAKRGRANHPATDDDDEDSDGELELAKLSPEEQERIISAKLASGTTTDKDARRLKRLLRNRVSAQQARERKKQYVTSLEEQIREQQAVIGVLEKRVKDLESQNEALRNIIRTMRPFRDPAPGAAGAGAGAGGATAPESAPGAQAGGAGAAARPPGAGQGQGQQLTPQQQQAMRARALALMQRRQAAAAAAAGGGRGGRGAGGEGQQQLLQEVPPSVQQHQQQLLPPTIQGPHHLQAPQPQPQPHEPHRRSLDESGSDTGHNAGSGTGGPKHFVPASPTAVDSLHQYHQQHQHYQYSQQTGQQQHHMQLPGHSQGHAMETNGTDLGGGDGHQMLDVQLGSSPMTSYGAVPFYGLPTFDIDLGDAAVVPPGPADGL